MLDEVASKTEKLVGTKQVLRALPQLKKIVLATDADEHIKEKIESAAKLHHIPVTYVPSKEELGDICEIEVHCACVGIL